MEDKSCYSCGWFAPDYETCCNADSEFRGDLPPADEGCPEWINDSDLFGGTPCESFT